MWTNNLERLNFKMDKIRLFDAFMGIGALHQSLKKLGVPVEIVGSSEIDVDAVIDYAAIHIDNFKDIEFSYPSEEEMRDWLLSRNIGYSFEKGKSSICRLKKDKLYKLYKASVLLNNLGDISKIDCSNMMDFDLFNFSFSCTDLSNAGKQRGMRNEDGTPTRSGLYVYGIDIIRKKKPKYIMIENVKGLIQKKFIDDFYDIVNELTDIGYNCYYPIKEDKKGNKSPICLNSKDYGIAQNRERIFIICIRKDIDNCDMEFPQGFDSGLRLRDFLEINVDEKYYLSQEIQNRFKLNRISHKLGDGQRGEDEGANSNNASKCVVEHKINIIGKINSSQDGLIHDKEGICQCLSAGHGNSPKILDISNGAIRGRYNGEGIVQQRLELRNDGNSNTITTVEKDNVVIENQFRIRKLTPKECFRLQGFDDECHDRCKEIGTSDSQLYKQAGNSITVNVLYYIFKNLFKDYIVK